MLQEALIQLARVKNTSKRSCGIDSACVATKVALLLGALADFHNILNFMPCTIVADDNYIKLAWCNQLCCNSTFISGKLLYSHLCGTSFHVAFPVSQRNLVKDRKNPFL